MDTKVVTGVIVIFFVVIIVSVGFCSCREHLSQIDPINPVPPQGKSVVLSDATGTLESLGVDSLLYLAIPKGGIIMWAGEVSKIPTGWKLCDGNNQQPINGIIIPDLRGRFVVGVSPGKSEMKAIGGTDFQTLTINQMPRHTHTLRTRTNGDGWCNYPPCGLKATDMKPGVADKEVPVTDTSQMTSIEAVGAGQAFDNRPPYYTLAYIIKV